MSPLSKPQLLSLQSILIDNRFVVYSTPTWNIHQSRIVFISDGFIYHIYNNLSDVLIMYYLFMQFSHNPYPTALCVVYNMFYINHTILLFLNHRIIQIRFYYWIIRSSCCISAPTYHTNEFIPLISFASLERHSGRMQVSVIGLIFQNFLITYVEIAAMMQKVGYYHKWLLLCLIISRTASNKPN